MKRLLLFVALTVVVSGGCKKKAEDPPPPSSGGGENAAVMAARRVPIVTAIEMHDLFILMNYAKGASGKVPTAQETWELLNKPDGNRQLVKFIQEQMIILVPNPQEQGLWAYEKDAQTKGGWVLTHTGESRVSAAEFNNLLRGN
ncbi:MAG TPA: hypothetical protein VHR66_32830 [Gemmataceae bacterium]|jgi:hypothetical protein|nr:hypothetical protein [Gemmataceae bacterium]